MGIRKKTFDEVFKNRIKQFFEPFAIVKTEFEILRLPKKVDILIIEAEKPIQDSVLLFTYFKKYNIIEFKSESDRFRIRDLYKMGHYINGVLLKENAANPENTTFTLVSTNKINWLFEKFGFQEVKKGLYVTNDISIIKVYVVLTSEIDPVFEREYGLLNVFTNRKQREQILATLLERSSEADLEDLFILYEDEVIKVLEKEGRNMTAIQERVKELADKYGVSEAAMKKGEEIGILKGKTEGKQEGEREGIIKGKQEGLALAGVKARRAARKEKLRTAINMKKKNLDLDLIASVTELKKKYLVRFFGKIR